MNGGTSSQEEHSLCSNKSAWCCSVLSAQAGKGSATLSMAYAAAKFAESCLLALQGQSVVECAYVESHLTDLPFFASQVRLGRSGVEVRPNSVSSTGSHLVYLMYRPACHLQPAKAPGRHCASSAPEQEPLLGPASCTCITFIWLEEELP